MKCNVCGNPEVLVGDCSVCITNELKKLRKENTVMRDALETLSRLGNEPLLGNSDGNMIAIKALAACNK